MVGGISKYYIYILIALVIGSATLNGLQYSNLKVLEKEIIINKAQISILTHEYITLSKNILLDFNNDNKVFTLLNGEMDLSQLMNQYDYILFINETNCMECIKSIINAISKKSNKKVGLIGKYSSPNTLLAITENFKIPKDNVYFTIDELFKNENLASYNKPYLFYKNRTTEKIHLLFIPIKEIEYTQQYFLKNEDKLL